MKKVFSVFLALTMLVCLCIPAAAAEANEKIARFLISLFMYATCFSPEKGKLTTKMAMM